MTATTKTYLQRLPVAFGVLVIAYVLRYIFLHSFEVEPSAIYWPQFPAFFVTGAGLLLAAGVLLEAIPAAQTAVIVHGGIAVFHFLLTATIGRSVLPPPSQVAVSFYYNIELLPYIFFISRLTRHWKQQRIWIIVIVLVLYRGIVSARPGYNVIDFSPSTYSIWYEQILTAFQRIGCWSAFVLLLVELILHADRNEKPVLNKLTISSGHHHGAGTLAFFSFKTMLLTSPTLLTVMLSAPPSITRESEYDWVLFLLRMDWLLSIICCMAALGAGVLYLRTHILEFMLRFDLRSKLIYWLLSIPLIGFIAWLLFGAMKQPSTNKSQQLVTLKAFRNDPLISVKIAVLAVYALIAAWFFIRSSSDMDYVYILAASAGLFLLSTLNPQAYRAQLYIQLAFCAYVIASSLLGQQETDYMDFRNYDSFFSFFNIMFMAQLALMGMAWSLLLLPALQPDYFKTDEEKTNTEGHLFAEHELQQ
jgi:hypothetical protein